MSEETILQEDGVILVEDIPIVETQVELQPDTPVVEIVTIVQNDTVDLGEPQTAMEVDWFGLPIRGKSAYQTWQELPGNAGKTTAEFIAAITGPENENAPLAQAAQAAIETMKEAIDATAIQVGLDAAQTASDRCAAHCSALAAKASELAAAASEADAAAYADAALAYRNAAEHFAERAETAYGLANASASVALDAKNQATASAVASATHVLEAEAWSNQAGNYASAAETMSLQAQAWRDDAESYAAASAYSRDQAQAFASDSEEWALSSSEAANTAETARSQAQNFRDEAALSATTAETSMAQATSQAILATNAKNQAGDSATAANISRNEASSFADQSGVYADSSYTASQVAVAASQNAEDSAEAANEAISTVEAYVNQAEAFAEAANTSNLAAQAAKADSQAAASAANTSKDTATAQATLAGTYATAASNSALTATTQANSAIDTVKGIFPTSVANRNQWSYEQDALNPTGNYPVSYYYTNSDGTPVWCSAVNLTETLIPTASFIPIVGRRYQIVWRVRRIQNVSNGRPSQVYPGMGFRPTSGYSASTLGVDGTAWTLNAWQNLTYEWIGEAGAWARPRLHVNWDGAGTSYSNAKYEVSGVIVTDITSEVASQNYATAAATSYSNAQASETAAGNYASSASGSANTATIKAGEASASATASANSAASSSASAAAAASSAILSASIGANAMTVNPVMASWSNASSPPDNWIKNGAGTITRVTGVTGSPYAAKIDQVGGTGETNMMQLASASAGLRLIGGGWVVVEFEFQIIVGSGNLTSFGVGVQSFNDAGTLIAGSYPNIGQLKNQFGEAPTYITGERIVTRTLLDMRNAEARNLRLYTFLYGASTQSIRVDRFLLRAATNMEIAAQRADTNATQALANVVTEQAARVAADNALATRATTVEAMLRQGSPNLVRNSDFSSGFNSWGFFSGANAGNCQIYIHPTFGMIMTFNGTPANSGFYQDFTFTNQTGQTMSLSAEGDLGSNAQVWVQFYSAGYGASLGYWGLSPNSWTTRSSITVTVPSGTAIARVGVVNITGANCSVARIQLQQGAPTAYMNSLGSYVVDARVSTLENTVATQYSAQATINTTLTSRVGTVESTATSQGAAIVDLQGRTEAYWKFRAAAGGEEASAELTAGSGGSLIRLIASKIALASSIGGTIYNLFELSGSRIKFSRPIEITVGSSTLCLGPGFGLSSNLVLWFGPTMDPSAMSKSNAKVWFDTSGNCYFGGSFATGTLRNNVTGTNTSTGVSATLGPFGTLGGPITIAWSYNWYRDGYRDGNQTPSGNMNATVRLYRTIAGGSETLIDTQVVNGSIAYEYDAGENYTTFRESAGASWTYTDNAGGTSNRTYRIEVVSRNNYVIAGSSASPDGIVQNYSIISQEG